MKKFSKLLSLFYSQLIKNHKLLSVTTPTRFFYCLDLQVSLSLSQWISYFPVKWNWSEIYSITSSTGNKSEVVLGTARAVYITIVHEHWYYLQLSILLRHFYLLILYIDIFIFKINRHLERFHEQGMCIILQVLLQSSRTWKGRSTIQLVRCSAFKQSGILVFKRGKKSSKESKCTLHCICDNIIKKKQIDPCNTFFNHPAIEHTSLLLLFDF